MFSEGSNGLRAMRESDKVAKETRRGERNTAEAIEVVMMQLKVFVTREQRSVVWTVSGRQASPP